MTILTPISALQTNGKYPRLYENQEDRVHDIKRFALLLARGLLFVFCARLGVLQPSLHQARRTIHIIIIFREREKVISMGRSLAVMGVVAF